MIAAENRNRIQ